MSSFPAARPREQWSLLGVLTGAHGTHVGEVADEVRRASDQLPALRGQAADEVQLVAFPPVAQGQGQGSLEVKQNSVPELVLASPAVPEGP